MAHEPQPITRVDFEGTLVYSDSGSAPLTKTLPLDVAWHIEALEDLAVYLPELVHDVTQDFDANALYVHYNPAIHVLDLQKLREMIHVGGVFAFWRMARLAYDLCQTLAQCHAAGIPQLIIDPGRVGMLDGHFVLLPSLAQVLPSFTQLPPVQSWLPFVAPEVLRTRGLDPALLLRGDIYALGHTLLALVADPPVFSGQLAALEQAVEQPAPAALPDGVANSPLGKLISEMCAPLPTRRPTLEQCLARLEAILAPIDLDEQITFLITDGNLARAEAALDDLDRASAFPPFHFPASRRYMLRAQLELIRTPPDFVQAIDHLNHAQNADPVNEAIYIQIAHTYLRFTQHPQHVRLAVDAYERALQLTEWRADILDAWLDKLRQLDPQYVLDRTRLVPWDKRIPLVFVVRAASLVMAQQYLSAWNECADYFERFGYSSDIFEIARAAAAHIPATELISWKSQRSGAEDLHAAMTIVWERNGNIKLAAEAWLRTLGTDEQ